MSADGIEIYFGVVPAPVISGHEMGHGGSPRAKGSHHLVIALFDSKTGKRVTDAEGQGECR
jgi:hypothetical protein